MVEFFYALRMRAVEKLPVVTGMYPCPRDSARKFSEGVEVKVVDDRQDETKDTKKHVKLHFEPELHADVW